MTRLRSWLPAVLLSALAACGSGEATAPAAGADPTPPSASAAAPPTTPAAPTIRPRVLRTYPHDAGAFTQGLIFHDGDLFESTGQNGQSSLRRVDLRTGTVLQRRALDYRYFAEGLTALDDELIQLTWESRTGFVYDLETFEPIRTVRYPWEGWGLTDDGSMLYLSDGSDVLHVVDPETFQEARRVQVRDGTVPVPSLNELEWVDGEIYANVWHANRIARIDPGTGVVLGWLDLAGLLSPGDVSDPEAVLNGIAWDAAGRRLFVTGKLWPKLFEIEPPAAATPTR